MLGHESSTVLTCYIVVPDPSKATNAAMCCPKYESHWKRRNGKLENRQKLVMRSEVNPSADTDVEVLR